MKRRDFLRLAAGSGVAAFESFPGAADLAKIRITRVSGFRHTGPRPKLVGKNSHLDVHGSETRDSVLRIETDQGIEGIGSGNVTPYLAWQLLGHALAEYWNPAQGIVSPLGRADHALYDLVAKALGVPAWKLLGGAGPEWVPVYDGGIYFNDLLPEHATRGVGRLLDEIDESLKEGHRAFKIKVGRGYKWMETSAGFKRDVEVVQAIRRRVGRDIRLMVDANNGFDLDTTKRWLDTAGDELFFIEEMFPEVVEQDLELKSFLRSKGWKTLVADGESAREIAHFDPFVAGEAIDVLQPDIRAFGLTLQWELSRRIAPKPGIRLAPHNWGSFLGLYMQLQLARGIPNFLMAEQDRSRSELFDMSQYTFKEGRIRVPAVPGCGIAIREDIFRRRYRDSAWAVSAG